MWSSNPKRLAIYEGIMIHVRNRIDEGRFSLLGDILDALKLYRLRALHPRGQASDFERNQTETLLAIIERGVRPTLERKAQGNLAFTKMAYDLFGLVLESVRSGGKRLWEMPLTQFRQGDWAEVDINLMLEALCIPGEGDMPVLLREARELFIAVEEELAKGQGGSRWAPRKYVLGENLRPRFSSAVLEQDPLALTRVRKILSVLLQVGGPDPYEAWAREARSLALGLGCIGSEEYDPVERRPPVRALTAGGGVTKVVISAGGEVGSYPSGEGRLARGPRDERIAAPPSLATDR
jgi:hypothetical protein